MNKKPTTYSMNAAGKNNDLFYIASLLMLIYYLAAACGGRGWYWFKEQEKVINESEFYKALHELFPIWIWGFVLLVVAVLYVLAGATFYKADVSNAPFYLLIVAGIFGGTFHFLLVSASITNAMSFITPLSLAWLTILMYGLAILSGFKIYDRKRK